MSLLERADNTLRDAATAAGVKLYRFEGTETIRRLVACEVVKNHTRNITLITLDGVRRLCRQLHLADQDSLGTAYALRAEIKTVIRTSITPPPSRHQPGIPTDDVDDGIDDIIQPVQMMHEALTVDMGWNDAPQQYQFPTAPPEVLLHPDQQRAPYALQVVPRRTQAEIDQFIGWSAAPVNTERSFK